MLEQKDDDIKTIKTSTKTLNNIHIIESEQLDQEKKGLTNKLQRTSLATNSNQKLQPIKPRILQQQQNGTLPNGIKASTSIQSNLKQSELKKKELIKKPGNNEQFIVTTQDLINTKKKLSANFILKAAGVNEIEEVENLDLQNQQIFVFEPELKLPILKVLNLQNNILINTIGLCQFISLQVLMIDNNQITDINPLNQLTQLELLSANNNKINSIKHLKSLQNLKILAIQKNNIADFDETLNVLQEMAQLQQLELIDNPCTKRFSYKYDILWALRLTHLDGEQVKDKDYEMSKAFYLQKSKDSIKSQELEKIQRPTTAMGRSTLIQSKQQLNQQQQQQQSLKFQEMELQISSYKTEIEQMTQQINHLMKENEALVEENEQNYQLLEEKEQQIQEFMNDMENEKYEAQFAKQLQKENLDLRHKIAAYEQTLVLKDCPEIELKQHIYTLNKTIEDQEAQIKALKKEIDLIQKNKK